MWRSRRTTRKAPVSTAAVDRSLPWSATPSTRIREAVTSDVPWRDEVATESHPVDRNGMLARASGPALGLGSRSTSTSSPGIRSSPSCPSGSSTPTAASATGSPVPGIPPLPSSGRDDVRGRRGSGLVAGPLVRVVPGSRAAGPARTALCGPGDDLAAHRLLETVQAGDVIVLAVSEARPVAVIGELIALQARSAERLPSWSTARSVTWTPWLLSVGPVWARSVSAAGPAKKVAGALGVPVEVGGVAIEPGDIVILDADGVVVVPP